MHLKWINEAQKSYEKMLIAYARDILGNAEEAKDAVQDTFVALCQEKQQEIEPKVKYWLFKVCRNQCLNRIRKNKHVQPVESRIIKLFPSPDACPEKNMQNKESASLLFEHLQSLPDNQREVIFLKFMQGMSYRDISAITQLTESNVGYLIHNGVNTLRHLMNTKSFA